MSNHYAIITNPKSGKKEQASIIDLGSYSLVTFPDGSSYKDSNLKKSKMDLPEGFDEIFKGFGKK